MVLGATLLMRIDQVCLFNFGIYESLNCFDFKEDAKKNVHLLLGENGTGKTTFLNGIKIGMYGSLYFGYSNSESSSYKKNILSKINSSYLGKRDKSCLYTAENPFIQIAFRMEDQGLQHHYILRREWVFSNNKKFCEEVKV